MKTQKQQIQDHLNKGKSITPLQALNKFGCFRLAARINELRMEHKIRTLKNKHGANFAIYIYEGKL